MNDNDEKITNNNNNKNKKLSLSTAIFLIIIVVLAISLIILGTYTFRLKNNNDSTINGNPENEQDPQSFISNSLNNTVSNDVIDNSTTNTTTTNNATSSTTKTLDINSEQVKNLYNYVLKYDSTDNGSSVDVDGNTNPTSFYKETKVTYDNLSNAEKIFAVLQSYGESGVKNVTYGSLKNIIANNIPNDIINAYYNTNVKVYENVSETAKKVFGKNSDINWRSYEGIGQLDYVNNNYYSYAIQAGGLGLVNKAYSKIIKAEQVGDNIYIYDNYILYDEYPNLVNGDSNIYLYKSSVLNSPIAKEPDSSFKDDGNVLLSEYKDKLYTYKHTFQKASDGSYYWVSTEPIK